MATREEARARALVARLRWPTSLAALRHRNYRLLWAGTAMTQTGQWAQQVATGTLPLGWLADHTGAPFAVGVAGSLCLLFAGLAAARLPSMRAL